ncbi:MAG: hypothetical protein EP330_19435 [Deltaproteobacteria bacterium]|nr:MAG: hypothetical protein EP330_19435 [Deltaproteobacteria bacterium]
MAIGYAASGGTIRVTPFLLLVACGGSTAWEAVDVDGLTHLEAVEKSRGKGIATFVFDVEEGQDAFLFTGDPEAPFGAYVRTLTDPNGDVVFAARDLADGVESLSGAQFANVLTTLNWPILATHPPLQAGRWKLEVGPLDEEFRQRRKVEVFGALSLKDDDDLSAGTLTVRIVYADGTDQDPELVRGTEAAVAVWEEIYAEHGLSLNVTYGTYTGPISQSTSGSDGDAYVAIAEESGIGVLNVVVISDFTDWQIPVYGVSGGIPGPLVPTIRSAVAVNGFTNAGPDLTFSEEEIRIYGETLAHEGGHYLGAFHPVEEDWSTWDAVDDTEQCGSESGCIQTFRDNLMFPYPVCSPLECTPQHALTSGQRTVLHYNAGVR